MWITAKILILKEIRPGVARRALFFQNFLIWFYFIGLEITDMPTFGEIFRGGKLLFLHGLPRSEGLLRRSWGLTAQVGGLDGSGKDACEVWTWFGSGSVREG
jgi:hypothetical protein